MVTLSKALTGPVFVYQQEEETQDHEEEVQDEHPTPPSAPHVSSEQRKQNWEQGDADYLGVDSFTHIERKLDSFLS